MSKKRMEEVDGHILKGGVDGSEDVSLSGEERFLKPGSATCLKYVFKSFSILI